MSRLHVRIAGILLLILIITGVYLFARYYRLIYAPNVELGDQADTLLYIPSGSTYVNVLELLNEMGILVSMERFDWLARKKNYPNHVHPGRYRLPGGMSNNRLIGMLRAGRQEPVQLVFNNIRSLEKLASVVAGQIEADSASLAELFRNEDFLGEVGLDRQTVMGVFLPNTYEFYWDTSAEEFLKRMLREYDRFWNSERLRKASEIGLSPMEVMTLASIVEEETVKKDEEAAIAGVYMNRIREGMRLQADPTVKFAIGDMNIGRVLKKHIETDSPYNTYRYSGLPPGPIRVPSLSAISAVLNYERHDYLYFCARDDFSGYHVFARTLDQHNEHARSYRKALNLRKIFN